LFQISFYTEERLKEYFTQWGELVDIILMLHPNTNKSRGFAFITFADIESAKNALIKQDHIIDEKAVEVKKAKPKEPIGHNNDCRRRTELLRRIL
jgi:RNA recognition motif-containing protein